MDSGKLPDLLTRIEQTEWHEQDVNMALIQLIDECTSRPSENGQLAALQTEIDKHFSCSSVEEILASLEKDPSEFASKTKEILLSKSPSSLKITLKQLIDGEEKTAEECFATDLILAKNFLQHEDFFEGVRSVVIDKDRNPQYIYKTLSDFSDEEMEKFFQDSSVTLN